MGDTDEEAESSLSRAVGITTLNTESPSEYPDGLSVFRNEPEPASQR